MLGGCTTPWNGNRQFEGPLPGSLQCNATSSNRTYAATIVGAVAKRTAAGANCLSLLLENHRGTEFESAGWCPRTNDLNSNAPKQHPSTSRFAEMQSCNGTNLPKQRRPLLP